MGFSTVLFEKRFCSHIQAIVGPPGLTSELLPQKTAYRLLADGQPKIAPATHQEVIQRPVQEPEELPGLPVRLWAVNRCSRESSWATNSALTRSL